MAKQAKTIEDIDAATKRWKTRLKRAVNKIEELDRQRARIAKRQSAPQAPATMIIEAGTPAPLDPKPPRRRVKAGLKLTPRPPVVTPEMPDLPSLSPQQMLAKAKALREELAREKRKSRA